MVSERRSTGGTFTQIGRALDARRNQFPARARPQRDVSNVGGAIRGEALGQANRQLRREIATLRQKQAFV